MKKKFWRLNFNQCVCDHLYTILHKAYNFMNENLVKWIRNSYNDIEKTIVLTFFFTNRLLLNTWSHPPIIFYWKSFVKLKKELCFSGIFARVSSYSFKIILTTLTVFDLFYIIYTLQNELFVKLEHTVV